MAIGINEVNVATATMYPVETIFRNLARLADVEPSEYERITREYPGILAALESSPFDAYPYLPETFGVWQSAYWSVVYTLLEDTEETLALHR